MKINLGNDTLESNRIIDNLKEKEIRNNVHFEEINHEVNLLGELNVEELAIDCPILNAENKTYLKENRELVS